MKNHTQDYILGKYKREECCSFSGGYVLKIEGIDKYFPQCCGELSDIIYWERVSEGQISYCEGHPCPNLIINSESIVFDFSISEHDEPFEPPLEDEKIEIKRSSLILAVKEAKKELDNFAERLKRINSSEGLNIADIEKLLIYSNPNYE